MRIALWVRRVAAAQLVHTSLLICVLGEQTRILNDFGGDRTSAVAQSMRETAGDGDGSLDKYQQEEIDTDSEEAAHRVTQFLLSSATSRDVPSDLAGWKVGIQKQMARMLSRYCRTTGVTYHMDLARILEVFVLLQLSTASSQNDESSDQVRYEGKSKRTGSKRSLCTHRTLSCWFQHRQAPPRGSEVATRTLLRFVTSIFRGIAGCWCVHGGD